ncbi:MAG: tetraacyldisaccharide 4'-kinase [Cyclobacteriaceae bacterium]
MLHFLLRPFSLLYGLATAVRNHLYDSGHRTSFSFDRFVLSVGNLSVGGTGKTPMTEYLIGLLGKEYSIATLSRGYGRKTKGYRVANDRDTAETIGDEPYQIFRKFPDVTVTVCEERAVGIPFILADFPGTDVILLDDAFQHRSSLHLTDHFSQTTYCPKADFGNPEEVLHVLM